MLDGSRSVEGTELVSISKQQVNTSIRWTEERAHQLELSTSEGLEQIRCLMSTEYAQQVRELEPAIEHNEANKLPHKRPVFVVLDTDDAGKNEPFIKELAQAHQYA